MQSCDEKKLIALPCFLTGKPIFKTQDGFQVFSATINEMSVHFAECKEKIPTQWIISDSKVGRGGFVVCINSDYPLFADIPYVFMGEIINHKTYGLQFKSQDQFPDEPSDETMMIEYLDRLPNVGRKRGRMIIKYFGLNKIADVIENRIDELHEAIPGITKERALEIQKRWTKDKIVRQTYTWIISHGISVNYGKKIIEEFGEKAIEILEENPYHLTEIKGIGFVKADEIAYKILKKIPRTFRTKSCIEYLLREKEDTGHVCYPAIQIQHEACRILCEKDKFDYNPIIVDIFKKDFVIYGNKINNVAYVYIPNLYKKEEMCSKFLADISKLESMYKGVCKDEDIKKAQDEASLFLQNNDLEFDENQKKAIKSAFDHKLTVLTGGGGTGKSTICRAICKIAKANGLEITLFAPTGQAAKVLENKTSLGASTIHRGLGLIPGQGKSIVVNPFSVEDTTIRSELLIVDEFSMVGTDLLPYVFSAIISSSTTNIILVGDPQQLPSVSPGNNLHDIINCGCANVVKLEKIYRQSEKSFISIIANEVAHGDVPGIPLDSDDFFWCDINDSELAMKKIEEIAEECNEKNELRDLQVISSIYARSCGVDAINLRFQDMFTRSENFIMHEKRAFFLGDRVMHVVNNYQKGVFNGNIGYIVDLGYKIVDPTRTDVPSYYAVVEFEGKLISGTKGKMITYENDEISELRVAWCSTVHKFQGGQKKYVVFVMLNDHRNMMSRELVYTAYTRAEKKLFVIGTYDMLALASRRSIIAARHTNLQNQFRYFALGNDNRILKVPESFSQKVIG